MPFGLLSNVASKIAIMLFSVMLFGCVGTAVTNDPDVLTNIDEIPERPGVLETIGGEKLEVEF